MPHPMQLIERGLSRPHGVEQLPRGPILALSEEDDHWPNRVRVIAQQRQGLWGEPESIRRVLGEVSERREDAEHPKESSRMGVRPLREFDARLRSVLQKVRDAQFRHDIERLADPEAMSRLHQLLSIRFGWGGRHENPPVA